MSARDDVPDAVTLMLTALGTGLVAAVAAVLVWIVGVARGVPDLVAIPNQGTVALGWVNIVVLSLISAAGAAIVVRLLAARGAGQRVFAIIALVVLVASMAPLLFQPDTVAASTRLLLGATHVIVYLAIAPVTGRLLTSR